MEKSPVQIPQIRSLIDDEYPEKKHLFKLHYASSECNQITVYVEKGAVQPSRFINMIEFRAERKCRCVPDMFTDHFEIV